FKKKSVLPSELKRPAIVVVGSMVLSLVVNSFVLTPQQLFFSSLYAVRWVMYLMLIGSISSLSLGGKKTIAKWMVIAGSAVVILGLIQLIFYNSLRGLYYLGWDEHLYRLFSTFLDPNFAGMYLVIFFIFVLPHVINNFRSSIIKQKLKWGVLGGLTFL